MSRLLFHTKLKFYLLVLYYSEPNVFRLYRKIDAKIKRHVKLSRNNLCTQYSQ